MSATPTHAAAAARAAVDDPVAARVRDRRLALGWSLKRLSAETGGLAPSFLFNIEGGRKVPSEEVAARIARALGDLEHEAVYRAWARVKSRGRTGRMDHDALLVAWDRLRRGFAAAPEPAREAAAREGGAREAGRLRVPVLADAVDPGDGVRPSAERVVNTLSLDPQLYGHDAPRAREWFARLRRPFAFPLAASQAARVPGLPAGYLAVVTRELAGEPDPDAVYVLRRDGRLEVAGGAALAGGAIPADLRAAGFGSAAELRAAALGRIELLLPDARR